MRLSELEKDLFDLSGSYKRDEGQSTNKFPADLKAKLPHHISDLIKTAGLSSVRNELAAILIETAGLSSLRNELAVILKECFV